ncbi:Endosomal protein P24B [Smittium culicis]|uniref:Endosomal protein P24B n=1 Tax=Smittium culicis TaxID=133412 RepID=A0A1R1X0R4_9FUNG|nr:Endosomal protein P24B [Smittium culicis]OMJ23179.1 Endosomal protein P24B [Smittium culicis]
MLLLKPFYLFLSALHLISAFTTVINPGIVECYYEILKKQDHFSISYEVVGKKQVDFVMKNNNGVVIVNRASMPEGNFGTNAMADGKFEYCFTNRQSHGIVVNFNPHSPEEEQYLNKIDSSSEVKDQMRDLSHNVEEVVDHFVFMQSRNTQNENVLQKLQSRVFWWATLQSIALISVCAWQVYYVTSIFKARGIV